MASADVLISRMEDPNVKRPRLDPVPYSGVPVRLGHHPSEPPTAHPQPPHTLPPPSLPHQQSAPPPSTPYRGPSGPSPQDPRPPQDHRALPIPAAHPNFNDQRPPEYGAPMPYGQQRSYSGSFDSTVTRPPSTHSQSEQQRPPPATSGPPESHPSHMDHGGPPPVYPVMEHHVSNGYPPPHPHEQYSGVPVAPGQSYPPTPVGAYAQPSAYGPGSQYGSLARRKQVRATQACNNCRQRKQKCDEQRPCEYCKMNDMECEYREVPPPKQDRSMTQLLEKIGEAVNRLDDLSGKVGAISVRLDSLEHHFTDRPGEIMSSPQIPVSSTPGTVRRPVEDASVQVRQSSHQPDAMAVSANFIVPGSLPPRPKTVRFDPHAENGPHNEAEAEEISECTLPQDHTTGASHLAKWNTIAMFYDSAGVSADDYLMKEEMAQGCLRLYGWGQGVSSEPSSTAPSPAESIGSGTDNGIHLSSLQDGSWGFGFTKPPLSTFTHPDGTHPGGLSMDGTLKLDLTTMMRLFESYLRNIHILHPFISPEDMKIAIEAFASRYGSSDPVSARSPFVHPAAHAAGQKRKRSSDVNPEGHPESPEMAYTGPQRRPIEKSPTNAVILLIMALGKICEHKRTLPAIPGEEIYPQPQGMSPFHSVKPSPTPSHSVLSSASTPTDDGMPHIPRSHHYLERVPSMSYERRDPAARNYDILPGFAYYAAGVEILGSFVGGGVELLFIHGYLLAGLYMGQLCRPMESFHWVNLACKATRLHIRKNRDKATICEPASKQKTRAIRLVFWTALQLESDILAELDRFTPSRITELEDSMLLPDAVLSEVPDDIGGVNVTLLIIYSAQASIRRILNRVHLALYSKEKEKKRRKLSWSGVRASGFFMQLQEWRKTLPRFLQWDDKEPPPTDVNIARLRGKYYGAAYIITRPFLHHALYTMEPQNFNLNDQGQILTSLPDDPNDSSPASPKGSMSPDTRRNREIIAASRECVRNAMYSTVAFDGLSLGDFHHHRWIVTNIHGTATAQFGNMLILAAVYNSWLRELVPEFKLDQLFARTIALLDSLAPLSRTMRIHKRILQNTWNICKGKTPMPRGNLPPTTPLASGSVSTSFSALSDV